jgi:hypothetical protein
MTAIGLDETLFAPVGRFGRQFWSTQILDVPMGDFTTSVIAETPSEHFLGFRFDSKHGAT